MAEQHVPAGADVERGHTFDGITEFDNRLPNWWLWTFYLACIFSVFYWLAYHSTGLATLPLAAYEKEMAAAEAEALKVDDESLRAMSADPEVVAAGKEIFTVNCVACHRPDAGGMPALGPNLTDKFWIHGGSPMQIYNTVTTGVIEKGMVAWESVLGAKKCAQVTSYVLTLRNTNVENGREPQGEPYDGN
ncbi:MAG: c-type cytochrome [Planctomycetes bacterium]|nr:c-type cytochrome [Planctomycetota bacterium]